MNNNREETPRLTVVPGTNPVAVTRAYAKARLGDESAVRWLLEQHRAGNSAATKALDDLSRLNPEGPALVA